MHYALTLALHLFLVVYSVLVLFYTMYTSGHIFYTLPLSIVAVLGLVGWVLPLRTRWPMLLVISSVWLLRFLERASFLILYDPDRWGAWLVIGLPIVLAFVIFGQSLKGLLLSKERPFKIRYLVYGFIIFQAIGLLSFVHKPHTKYIDGVYHREEDPETGDVIVFPWGDDKCSASVSSVELRKAVMDNYSLPGQKDIYLCPQIELHVVLQFKKLKSLRIIGFVDTETNEPVRLSKPVDINLVDLHGERSVFDAELEL